MGVSELGWELVLPSTTVIDNKTFFLSYEIIQEIALH